VNLQLKFNAGMKMEDDWSKASVDEMAATEAG
jgi:hypothetical protein